jgi:hypothetical protein
VNTDIPVERIHLSGSVSVSTPLPYCRSEFGSVRIDPSAARSQRKSLADAIKKVKALCDTLICLR